LVGADGLESGKLLTPVAKAKANELLTEECEDGTTHHKPFISRPVKAPVGVKQQHD
jgi:hypothetical protein